MDIYEAMRAAGANEAQLTSKTMQMVEQILAKQSDVIPDTLRKNIDTLAQKLGYASQRYDETRASLANILDHAKSKVDWLNSEAEKASAAYEKAMRSKDSVITDKDLMEAVKAYRAVLEATRDVFGDVIDKSAMSDCIVAAINAGSYVAWRGIMGPKDKATKNGWAELRLTVRSTQEERTMVDGEKEQDVQNGHEKIQD